MAYNVRYFMYWGSWVLSTGRERRGLREHWASRTKLKFSFETLWEWWASVCTSVLIVILTWQPFFILIFGLENSLLFSMSIWKNIFYLHSLHMYVLFAVVFNVHLKEYFLFAFIAHACFFCLFLSQFF